jgi:hypothetical protein
MTFTTPVLVPATPVACACDLRDVPALFDAVAHREGCPVLEELEALISGDLLPGGDVLDADVPAYVMQYGERGWALVEVPGINGESSLPSYMR